MKTGLMASELRIGNWIEYLGEQSQCDVNTIYAISLISKPRDSVMYKPIPLTEDWLIRFGFEHYESNNSFQLDTKFGFCFWGRPGDGIGVSSDGDEAIGVDVHYVHQLQNLYFALTQTELQTALSGKNDKV